MSWQLCGKRLVCTLGLFSWLAPLVLAGQPLDNLVATAAETDPQYGSDGGYALTLKGVGDDFVFSTGGQFFRRSDGTVRLTALATSQSDPRKCFALDLEFGFPSLQSDAIYPPAGFPRLELADSAYVWNGGPIDPSEWTYFQGAIGTLRGLEDCAGAILTVTSDGPAFQIGAGANGKNLHLGASAWFRVQTVEQPTQGPALPTSFSGSLNLGLGTDTTRCANAAIGHPLYVISPAGHALAYAGSGYIFRAGGQLVEYANGTADFHGVLQKKNDSTKVFAIDLNFSGRVNPGDPGYPPPGSPKKELAPSAYIENGGPVDANTWYYYTNSSGKLTGFEDYAGAVVNLIRTGPSFQIGIGANGKNLHFGGSGWFDATVVLQPTSGPPLPPNSVADINIDLDRDCFFCVDRADAKAGVGSFGGHAFVLPGIGSGQFVFLAPGQFVETAADTAQLSGELVSLTDPTQKFAVRVDFAGRLDPGDPGYPPAGSPHLELAPAAYLQNGGPIDPGTWHYYQQTNGEFHGIGAFDGAFLTFVRLGPSFQVGVGANGKNFNFGASGWIDVTTLIQPSSGPNLPSTLQGDINVDMRNDCLFCPQDAQADPVFASLIGGHVLYLPGVGPSPQYVLEGVGRYTEYDIGSARLRGIFHNVLDPNKKFQVALGFKNRVNPGEPGYPPPGSPKLDLQPFAYVQNGGPIDPNTWHYFLETDGFMMGLGDYAGAQYHVTRLGPAFQVGVGASGLNLDYGASGWLDLQIVSQPTSGGPLPASVAGDLNMNLLRDCP